MTDRADFFPPMVRRLLLAALLAGALAIRLYKVDEAPRDFWTLRQYNGLMMARAMYMDNNADVPEWRREVVAGQPKWLAEPPILEYLSSRVFRLMGSEAYWVPRLMTVSVWVLGGLFLYLAAASLLGGDAALIAAAYYLFAPYGVTASRSFQPDPLMIGGLMAAVWAIVRYFEKPAPARLVVAAAISALDLLFKPGPNLFSLAGVFGMLSVAERGWAGTLRSGRTWLFAVLVVAPSLIVNIWAQAAGLYQAAGQLLSYWSPHLIPTLYFWKGWLGILLLKVLGPVVLLLAFVGFLLFPAGRARVVLWGLVIGYLAQSILCQFTTPNHDYWHLHAIPIAALCLGGLSCRLWRSLPRSTASRLVVALVGAGVVLLSVERAPWKREDPSPVDEYQRICREIGEAVNHSARTVMLDYDFGSSLRYFAEIDGRLWPETDVLTFSKKARKDRDARGRPLWNSSDITPRERFDRFYAPYEPEYFIICRLTKELDLQAGLREFLASFPVVARTSRYVIYDLRRAADGDIRGYTL